MHFAIVIIAYYFHCRFRDFIADDINKWITVNITNNVDKRRDIVSLITAYNLQIPRDIKTVHPLAGDFLQSIQNMFLHNLTWTIIDHEYLRFSWIKADKSNPDDFARLLRVGDSIFYHSKKSIIGLFIRFITRCYWEHVAVYMGNGEVLDVVPGGIRPVRIMTWIRNDRIELAVLRHINSYQEEYPEIIAKYIKEQIGRGYNYWGVFVELWHILTDKKGSGLMKYHIFLINIILISTILLVWFRAPYLTRLHLFLLMVFTPYLIDTVYHWWAYKRDWSSFNKLQLLKKGNT